MGYYDDDYDDDYPAETGSADIYFSYGDGTNTEILVLGDGRSSEEIKKAFRSGLPKMISDEKYFDRDFEIEDVRVGNKMGYLVSLPIFYEASIRATFYNHSLDYVDWKCYEKEDFPTCLSDIVYYIKKCLNENAEVSVVSVDDFYLGFSEKEGFVSQRDFENAEKTFRKWFNDVEILKNVSYEKENSEEIGR